MGHFTEKIKEIEDSSRRHSKNPYSRHVVEEGEFVEITSGVSASFDNEPDPEEDHYLKPRQKE